MKLNHDPGGTVPPTYEGQSEEETAPRLERVTLKARPASPARLTRPGARRRRVLRIMTIILLIALILALVRLGSVSSATDDQLLVRLGSQGTATVDLRQSLPISPYLFGANVFPEISTSSVDHRSTGFMSYGFPITSGLRNAQIDLLRFPGGTWGEEHLLSYDQLNAFSILLSEVGADGMIQAQLTGITGRHTSLTDRASLAGRWVDYMNNPRSYLRKGKYAHAPFHYDDEYVTREETPHTIEQFVRQRTRWNQGFIQIFFKWEWLKLPKLSQRLLAFYVLILPELQALFAVLVPVAIAMIFLVKFPLWLAMFTFMPLCCFILAVFIDLAGLHEFLKAHKRKWRWREAVILVLAFFPYQFILGAGACRAVYRYIRGASNWEKTAHIGQHRDIKAA